MFTRLASTVTALVLFGTACGPSAADQLDAGSADDPVELACREFCRVAENCDGYLYVDAWNYDTQAGCVDYCEKYTRSTGVEYNNDECVDITTEIWSCGAESPTCEDFEWFMYAHFGMTGLINTLCVDEMLAFYESCK